MPTALAFSVASWLLIFEADLHALLVFLVGTGIGALMALARP